MYQAGSLVSSSPQGSRGFWYECRAILYICSIMILGAGCQVFDQVADIPDIISNNGSLPEFKRPEWDSLPKPIGPQISGHAGSVVALKAVGSPVTGLYSLGADRKILYWDLVTGKATVVRSLPGSVPADVAAFGQTYAVVAYSSGNHLTVECITECPTRWDLNRLRARAKTIDFHNSDSAVLLGSVDGKVSRWKYLTATGAVTTEERDKSLELYAGHQTVVSSVVAHPFNRAFFTGDWTGSFYAWLPYDSDDFKGEYDRNLFTSHFYAAPGTFAKGLREVDRGIISMAISKDGTGIALGTENGFLETWNVRGFERESRLEAHRGRILSVDISPSGNRVATIGRDGYVRLFEITEG